MKPASKIIPLNRLAAGQSARVTDVVGHPDHVHRIEEFGVRGGVMVEMFRPGKPCIIRMAGIKVCLRSDDRLTVLVEPTAA